MKRLLLFSFVILSFSLHATLPEGAIAEDWTLDDIDGNTHSLYADYLDQGWSVVIDMSATWCGPCWTFHQSGTMEDIYDDYGPSGEGIIMPMMIEVDPNTNQACFYGSTGCNSSTTGNWSAGVDYPLFNPPSSEANTINNDYQITVFPTMYVISPSGYVKPFTGSNTSYEDIESWGAFSFQMENTTYTVDAQGCGDDSIDLHPEGGLGSISYLWSNGATTEDISGLVGGEYFVTMTDDNGYEWVVGPIDVDGFDPITVDDVTIVEVDCYGNNTGSIDLDVSGGSGNLSYEWDNGGSTAYISSLYGGRYDLTITDDVSGCEIFDSYSVYEPDEIEVEYEITPAECGETVGEIEFDNDGGTSPFTYLIDGNTYNYDVIELPVGSYTADITDANGCMESASFTIDAAPTPTSSSSATGPITCTNTTTTLNSAGSSTGSNITYNWYDSNGTNIGTAAAITVSNSGTYMLEVADTSSGCTSSSTVSVTSNTSAPTAMTSSSSNNLTCSTPTSLLSGNGSSAGANFAYLWSSSNGTISGSITTQDITVSSAGTYNLQVTDTSNGCVSNSSVTITQSGVPSIAATGNASFCQGSSTNICVPLSANETIEWTQNGVVVGTSSCFSTSTSSTYIVLLTNSVTGCTSTETIQTTVMSLPNADISGNTSFCAGASTTLCYTPSESTSYEWMINGSVMTTTSECITVNSPGTVGLNANNVVTGCGNFSSKTITQNALPTASIASSGNIDCSTSESTLDLTTNAQSATYAWYDQGGTLIATSEDITVSQAGTYTAYVTNGSGCQTQASVAVIADTSVPVISIDPPAVIDCNNSSAMLNLNVNNSNYTINWYDMNGNIISSNEDVTVTSAGQYTAVVANTSGCETQASVVVEADTSLPTTSIAPPQNLDCNNSSVLLDGTVTNATAISWFDENNNVLAFNEDLMVTTAGTYYMTATNAAGCETSVSIDVVQVDNAAPEAGFEYNNTEFDFNFTNTSTGTVTSYLWTFGDGNVSTEANPVHAYTTPGYYTVTLETTNECGSTTETFEVLAVANLTSAVDYTDLSCAGSNNGSATINTTGGLAGYNFEWSDATLSGASVSDLAPGVYSVIVTDQAGAQTTVEFTIAEPAPITISADVVNTISTANDGSIVLAITGGTGNYTVVWSDGGDGTNLAQGEYTATITDENGCEYSETFVVQGTSNVNDIEGLVNYTVSPNPASTNFRVQAQFEKQTVVTAYLVNMIGQRELLGNYNTNRIDLDVDASELTQGIYFIELQSANQIALKRVSVIK